MTYFDNYKNRVLSSGTTVGERIKNDYQLLLDLMFEDSPNLVVVKHNGIEKKVRLKDYQPRHTITVFASIISDNYKELYFRDLNDVIKVGDIFEYDNYQWLCVDTQHSPTTNSCTIRKCSNTLKIGDYSVPCFLESYHNTENNDMIILDTDKILCVTQYNENTKIISDNLPYRIVLNNKTWKIIGSDDGLSKAIGGYGILFLTLQIDQLDSKDNITNGIAYNEQPIVFNSYIINGSSIIILNQKQNYYIVDNESNIVTSQQFTWSVSNDNVKIIDYNNFSCIVQAIKEGETILTATNGSLVLTKNIVVQSTLW